MFLLCLANLSIWRSWPSFGASAVAGGFPQPQESRRIPIQFKGVLITCKLMKHKKVLEHAIIHPVFCVKSPEAAVPFDLTTRKLSTLKHVACKNATLISKCHKKSWNSYNTAEPPLGNSNEIRHFQKKYDTNPTFERNPLAIGNSATLQHLFKKSHSPKNQPQQSYLQ